ncbi:hypothetical protein LTR04_006615 [Oleoguttula sp. CCFEE 6159]|nr:hypothetical protein LTR04_006615 [Oleoguttula sp. CCFEE 6159]
MSADSCKYEHPRGAGNIQNRYAPFQNQTGNRSSGQSQTFQGVYVFEDSSLPSRQWNHVADDPWDLRRGSASQPLPYHLSAEIIASDLKTERPIWPFSAYGPGRDAPRQLIGGFPIEQSFEEMRVAHYLGMASGNVEQAIQNEHELNNRVTLQIQNVLNDLDGAIRYVVDGDNEHPNRRDICKESTTATASNQQAQSNPFRTSQSAASAFGQPSLLNTAAHSRPAFGSAGLGQPSVPVAPSAFGQPSPPMRPSAFGQPSAPGPVPSAFGQPSVLVQSSPFAQPSAFGQAPPSSNQAQPSTFGQPGLAQAQASAFGANPQRSAFGQPSLPRGALQPSVFGQPAQSTGPSPFSQAVSSAPFGAAPATVTTGPFGSTAPGTNPTSGGFGRPSGPAAASPFSQPTTAAASTGVFGRPSGAPALGQSSQPSGSSPFAQASTSGTSNPFGGNNTHAPSTSPFARPSNMVNGSSNQPSASQLNLLQPTSSASADISSYSTRGANGVIQGWKGQPVSIIEGEPHYQRADGGGVERIWFPNGPPPPNPFTELPADSYNDVLKEAYAFVSANGAFKDGIMPEIAPKREWVRWDI